MNLFCDFINNLGYFREYKTFREMEGVTLLKTWIFEHFRFYFIVSWV